MNRACCELAERQGIPAFFLHAGGNLANRLQTLMVGRGNAFDYFAHMRRKWNEFSDRPCPERIQKQITDHFIELFKGRHFLAYSSARKKDGSSARERYGIPPQSKLLVAALSSYDERFAGEVVDALRVPSASLFNRQVDWIVALIDYVRTRPDLFLLIRVHPREFPNKREGVKSEHAGLLEAAFVNLPINAQVNWPSDQVSLYDLAQEADLFLNAWSSVGKEMSLLGLPVVIYSSELVLYPPELNYLGETLTDYFLKIAEALRTNWSWDRVRTMYRWYALEFSYGLADISDGYPTLSGKRSLWTRILDRLWRIRDPYVTQRRDCRDRRPLRAAAALTDTIVNARASLLDSTKNEWPIPPTEKAENESLRRETARLAAALGRGDGRTTAPVLADRLASASTERS